MIRVTRQFLEANGIDPAVLDRALAASIALESPTSPVLASPGQPRLIRASAAPGSWEGILGDYRPCSKNLKSRGVRAWILARRQDNAAVALWANHPAGPPPATTKRRVRLIATRKRTSGRLPDPQNLVESFLDSLVVNRLLVDDSGRWASVAEPDLQVDGKLEWSWMTVIRLEDVG
jgi:hypothetical protein